MSLEDQFVAIQHLLRRSDLDPRQIVVMMCGIAGSGKSTIARRIVTDFSSFERLSIDELVAEMYGLWNIDYEPEKYEEHQDTADIALQKRLLEILEDGKLDVVIDRSFWARETRDEFRELVRPYGVRTVLLYLKPPGKDFIRQRIDQRRDKGRDANSALDIDDKLLDRYWLGFEPPQGEGELVLELR